MQAFRRFKGDQSGATAVIFGLALLPVIGLMGAAVDYGRASSAHAKMQKAVDATALALAREAGRLSDAELKRRGQQVFRSLFQVDSSTVADPAVVTRHARGIRVSASGAVKTTIMTIAGFDAMAIGSAAEVAWSGRKIELALVLDNTGSMASRNKLEELKKASHSLLRTLKSALSDPNSIKVSVVPFNTQVRLDRASRNEFWLAYSGGARRANWQGYVEDRDQPHDVNNRRPDRIRPETHFPAVKRDATYHNDLATVLPLTTDFDAAGRTVDAMRAEGWTNIALGVAWGLATLSPDMPMGGGGAFGARDVDKIMIVLTDGDNTRSRVNGSTNWNTGVIDGRTRAACGTAKTAGVRVYMIRVIEGNASLLRDCASRPTDSADPAYRNGGPLYFDVQDAAQLMPVFQSIASEILGTRLTH